MPDRFPPPYTIHESRESWEVRDANDFSLCWFCFRIHDYVGAPDGMTKQQAYAFAKAFTRLPELLQATKNPADPKTDGAK